MSRSKNSLGLERRSSNLSQRRGLVELPLLVLSFPTVSCWPPQPLLGWSSPPLIISGWGQYTLWLPPWELSRHSPPSTVNEIWPWIFCVAPCGEALRPRLKEKESTTLWWEVRQSLRHHRALVAVLTQ